MYQLCTQRDVGKIIQEAIDIHKTTEPDVDTIGTKLIRKLIAFNNSLFYVSSKQTKQSDFCLRDEVAFQ